MKTPDTVAILKSLGDETRLSIVRKLALDDGEVNSQDIVQDCAVALTLSQPTISHHFQKLVGAGVLSERKAGATKYYSLNRQLLQEVGIDADKL